MTAVIKTQSMDRGGIEQKPTTYFGLRVGIQSFVLGMTEKGGSTSYCATHASCSIALILTFGPGPIVSTAEEDTALLSL
jgi:hypothetical protein